MSNVVEGKFVPGLGAVTAKDLGTARSVRSADLTDLEGVYRFKRSGRCEAANPCNAGQKSVSNNAAAFWTCCSRLTDDRLCGIK